MMELGVVGGAVGNLDQEFLGKNVVVVLRVLVLREEEILGVLQGWWNSELLLVLLVVLDQEFLGTNDVVVLTVLVFPEGEFLGVLLR